MRSGFRDAGVLVCANGRLSDCGRIRGDMGGHTLGAGPGSFLPAGASVFYVKCIHQCQLPPK